MDTAEIIRAMSQSDTHKAWEAAWEIIRLTDEAELNALVPYISKFQNSRKLMGLVRGLRDRRYDIDTAIALLEVHKDGKCRCSLYEAREMFSEQAERERGAIVTESSELFKELWEEHFHVTCNNCGKKYLIKEIHGYHYPFWKWVPR